MSGSLGGEATGCFEGQREATIDFAAKHPELQTYPSNLKALKDG
jgi:hypothetical protein